MQFDGKKLSAWREALDESLPKIFDVIGDARGRGLILGASVLQIYYEQGWLPRARATGDLDLSVGIVSNAQEYQMLRTKLLALGYIPDEQSRHYRLISPVKVGLSRGYVDLLAHPEGTQISADEARATMGVGPGWSFNEILFALEAALQIAPNVYVPNPLGFLALKAASYIDNPNRTKDLVDIVDVVFGIVRNALHFDLNEVWQSMKTARPTEATTLKSMITGISKGEIRWDFSRAEQEFIQRGYDMEQVEYESEIIFSDLDEQLP